MPQTTGSPSSGNMTPFSRLSRQMSILGPSQAGLAYGALWTPILKPVGGYMRYLDLTLVGSGGTQTGGVQSTGDWPWALIQNLFLRDPFGQPIIQADGYSLYLINVYGGQCGMLGFGNQPTAMPSYSIAGVAAGNCTLSLDIPFEMDSSGYCSLASMNASSQPQLQIQLNTAAGAYTPGGTAPSTGTAATFTLTADESFWGAPVDHPEVAPPDVGSSGQWSVARAQSTVAASAFQRIVLPRVGTWIHTLILVMRDSTNLRVDAWPTTDLTFWVDGVPVLFESFLERQDNMFRHFGVTRPTGVVVYTFRNSVQWAVSTADTYDLLLPTTPATLLEVAGTFGSGGTPPYTIQVISGELFPVGGIPYSHLAQ
jgi:hypothetical protein